MIRGLLIAMVVAVLVHGVVLLFGGAFKFLLVKKTDVVEEEVREVALLEEDAKKDDKKEETKKVDKVEEVPADQMPDTTVLEEMDRQPAAPALSAVSLADLESALGGGGGGFGSGMSFGSGGVIGGTGTPGEGGGMEEIMGGASDSRPRLLASVKPSFPPALQRKGGSITLIVFVGADGRVMNVQVEKASEPGLERAAVDAVKRWTFEPAARRGQKIPSKIRQTIRVDPANA